MTHVVRVAAHGAGVEIGIREYWSYLVKVQVCCDWGVARIRGF